ncbi:MAG: nuclear transport factor 2 family protein [Myxococcota bacterium]|nr:nuclear transport factor 2 family protein [Myxococcota bacterium]
MQKTEREALARGYFERVGAGDREGLLALLCPDLRWVVPRGAVAPFAGVHEGAEKIVDLMLGAVGAAFEPGSQESELVRWIHGDDATVVEVRMRARAGDGRRYENDYAFFFEFRDGRIAEIREYVDTRTAALFFGTG